VAEYDERRRVRGGARSRHERRLVEPGGVELAPRERRHEGRLVHAFADGAIHGAERAHLEELDALEGDLVQGVYERREAGRIEVALADLEVEDLAEARGAERQRGGEGHLRLRAEPLAVVERDREPPE